MASKKKPVKKAVLTAAKKTAPKAAAKKSAAKKATPSTAKSVLKKVAAEVVKAVAKVAAPTKAAAPAKTAKTSVKEKSSPFRAGTFKEFLAPLDDRVLIEPAGVSEKTAGGLFIPATAQERPLQGTVLAVGKGARSKKGKLRPLDVKVGDEVLYAQFTGTNLELGGREVVLLKESEVLGIMTE